MPIEANYGDDEDEVAQKSTKTSTSKAPNLDDSEAFPSSWGAGHHAAAVNPSGKSLAELAAETLPEQKVGIDLNQPIVIKMPRPKITPRINKVKDMYKSEKKKMGDYGFTMYHDNGIPPGVPEKKAPCEMTVVGEPISTLQDFGKCWREMDKLPQDNGTNIRLFRSDFADPSPDSEKLEKGGKYQIWVGKDLVQDTFEELCFYFMDKRLDIGQAIVGLCWCVRQNHDLVQLWTKSASSPTTQEVFIPRLQTLLGMQDANVSYMRLSEAYPGKKIKAHKYYLVENVMPSEDDVVTAADNIVQMREIPKKKTNKTGPDEFTEIHREHKPRKSVEHDRVDPNHVDPNEPTGTTVSENPYAGILDDEGDDGKGDTGEDIEIFEKKKTEKSRKGSTKRGSRKEKKGGVDDFELPDNKKPLVSQQVFVAAGLGGILVVALMAMAMSGVLK